ncbi:MAG: DHA2 family efflux MFS transporter permease subunit, partial [Propionibacteriaceae bacterium]|nr:DHA2 family efflux MFS transporter permease subunit [Propionibacteriaceae bacterium]
MIGASANQGPPAVRPWAAVVVMLVGFFMLMMDSNIVSVANPTIQASLGASLTQTIWVTSAYLLGVVVPLLLSGRLGDRFGQKTLFMIGMVVFTLASLWCGLATSIESLIAARAVQGVGGALMSPQTQAMIVRIFPPHRRGAAMGLWGTVAGIATLIGPVVGGLLVQQVGWQAIFLINVPVGIVGVILAWRLLPKLSRRTPRFDWVGMVLSGGGIFLVVFGLQEGTSKVWGPVWGWITIPQIIIIGVVLLIAFVVHQNYAEQPLIPLRLFRDRDFSLANSAIFLVGAAIAGMSLPLLYFIQVGRGYSPAVSAIFMMPSAVISGILAPIIGRLIGRLSARRIAVFGLSCMALTQAWYLLYLTPDSTIWWILLPSCLAGFGNACMWSPIALSATHRLPPSDAGAGAGGGHPRRPQRAANGAAARHTQMYP